MTKFAFITGYVSVLCKIVCFIIAFSSGYLFYDYENKFNRNQNGTIWKCFVMSVVMFTSTLLCDILMTLFLIRHQLELQKIKPRVKSDDNDSDKPQVVSMFTLPIATHFENRLYVKKCTRTLSIRYLLVLSLWLFISILFVVGHWLNFAQSMYKEEQLLEQFLFIYIVVTVIFTIFIFLPLGIILVIGLY